MTLEALTAQEENAEADKLIESLQNGVGGAVHTTRMCYMCFDDVDEPSNPLVRNSGALGLWFTKSFARGSTIIEPTTTHNLSCIIAAIYEKWRKIFARCTADLKSVARLLALCLRRWPHVSAGVTRDTCTLTVYKNGTRQRQRTRYEQIPLTVYFQGRAG